MTLFNLLQFHQQFPSPCHPCLCHNPISIWFYGDPPRSRHRRPPDKMRLMGEPGSPLQNFPRDRFHEMVRSCLKAPPCVFLGSNNVHREHTHERLIQASQTSQGGNTGATMLRRHSHWSGLKAQFVFGGLWWPTTPEPNQIQFHVYHFRRYGTHPPTSFPSLAR